MAVTVYMGRSAWVGAGEESVWGTAVSRTHYFRVISTALRRKVNKVGRPHLAQGTASGMRRSHFTQSDNVEGDIEMEMAYEGFGLWLKHALMGTPATTGPVSSIYTHTYKLAQTVTPGLTIEQAFGIADDSTVRSEIFEGCSINSLRVRVAAGEVARLGVSIIGETSATRASAGSPTHTTNDVPMLHNQAGAMTFNSVSYTVKSMEITLENNLSRRMLLGSTNTKQPMRGDFAMVKMKVALELSDDNLITATTADTQGDVACTFTGLASRTSTWTVSNAFITDYSDPVNNAGIIERTVEFTGESNGTNEGLQFAIANLQTTATAA